MAAEITALRIEPAKCTGCKQCELACSWVQTGAFQPSRSLIRVHVFDEQTRSFYGLERLWADAPDVTREFPIASTAGA